MTWPKLLSLCVVLWLLSGCQITPEHLQAAGQQVLDTTAAAGVAASAVIPPPWGAVMTAAATLIGGVLFGLGKIKSYNKGRQDASEGGEK